MDNKSTTKRMIGAVVLVLVAALLLAWLLKGKNRSSEETIATNDTQKTEEVQPIVGFPNVQDPNQAQEKPALVAEAEQQAQQAQQVAQNTETATQAAAEQAQPAQAETVAQAPKSENTGFDVTPSKKGEMREITDIDGKNINAKAEEAATVAQNEAEVVTAAAAAAAQEAATAATKTKVATQQKEEPKQQEKPKAETVAQAPKARIVNETRVPEPTSVESEKRRQAREAARVAAIKAKAEKEEAARVAAAKDTSTEAVTAAAAGRAGYVIQVLATGSRGKANGVKQSIAVDGYPAFITSASVNGKSVYRVRIGTYTAKRDAVAVQAQMKARYSKNQFVQNSFVTNNK